MKINAATKIASLLKHDIRAMDAIISISPRFEKLRNPLLRKLLAGRTTIAMASKIGGCTVDDFMEQLEPLGFETEERPRGEHDVHVTLPAWLLNKTKQEIEELDVRPVLDAGQDPLKQILVTLRVLPKGRVLKIINTFEPTPLISMVEKKGFASYVEAEAEDLIATYLCKESDVQQLSFGNLGREEEDWEEVVHRYKDRLIRIDVRVLPMPQPMITILEALEHLAVDEALFVEHKKTPVYLLPELRERGFDYRIKEVEDQHVQLLIFK
jgi:uncharacterized protein (DUF2249 family)